MVDKLKEIEKRFLDVEGEVSKPEVVNDMKKYTSLNKEYKFLDFLYHLIMSSNYSLKEM